MILTRERILRKSKKHHLKDVIELNLWGKSIVDISIARDLINIEILSLSQNEIHSLQSLKYCKKLKEVYIRNNPISDLTEIVYLTKLNHLTNLWFSNNMGSQNHQYYRHFVIRLLPKLEILDDIKITSEEREKALHMTVVPDALQALHNKANSLMSEDTILDMGRENSPKLESMWSKINEKEASSISGIPPIITNQDTEGVPLKLPQTTTVFQNSECKNINPTPTSSLLTKEPDYYGTSLLKHTPTVKSTQSIIFLNKDTSNDRESRSQNHTTSGTLALEGENLAYTATKTCEAIMLLLGTVGLNDVRIIQKKCESLIASQKEGK